MPLLLVASCYRSAAPATNLITYVFVNLHFCTLNAYADIYIHISTHDDDDDDDDDDADDEGADMEDEVGRCW